MSNDDRLIHTANLGLPQKIAGAAKVGSEPIVLKNSAPNRSQTILQKILP